MKNAVIKIMTFTAWLLALTLTSCQKDEELGSKIFFSQDLITVPLFIEDEYGEAPMDPETMLFETRMHNPIVDRQGNQLSFEAFSTVRGSLTMEEQEEGTRISLKLNGLIPYGLYTIWNVTFQSPGFDPSVEGMNLVGLGVAGKPDGSESYFRASENGTANFTAFTPEGPLSMLGKIAKHPRSQEFEWHVVGSYHMDDKTHGPELGPDGTVVEQFAFVFKNI